MKCNKKAQGRTCVKELNHSHYHQDNSGFKFIDEYYPDIGGNGPDGYPMNNAAFDAAAAKILESRKKDAEAADKFLQKLSEALRAQS